MSRSLTFIADGDVRTRISITENPDGTLTFDISVIGSTVGDLRAIFLDLNGLEVAEGDLYITDAADVYDYVSGEGDIDKISKDANIKGSVSNELGDFDLGIEFGTSGMSQDDIQSTTFILGSISGPLTLDMLSFADFGLRYTSVGTGEDRNASAKIGDTTGGVADNDALDVSENESGSVNLLANDSATGTVVPQTVTLSTAAGVFGTLTIATDGTATVIADGPAADAMNDGDTAQFVVEYTVEGVNAVTTASLTVTITGATDGIPLFTEGDDVVDFNTLETGVYDPATFYDALGGMDQVYLPTAKAAAELGFDLTQTFATDGDFNRVYGSTGDDQVAFGDGRNNVYFDLGGDDVVSSTGNVFTIIVQAAGNDVYNLNDARNVINYIALNDGVVLDIGNGTATGAAGNQTINGFLTDASMTNSDDIVYGSDLTPSTNSYRIFLFDGDDTFIGRAANEILFLQAGSGSGHNTLDGGGGVDVLAWNYITSDMVIDAAAGTYSGWGTGTFANFEEYHLGDGTDIFYGSEQSDRVLGRLGDDQIYGRGGNDFLYDGAGNDLIDGGAGDDLVFVQDGTDVYIGGDGFDMLLLTDVSQSAGVHLDLGTGTLTKADGSVSEVSGFEFVRDGIGDDTIIGSAADEVLRGEFGNDVLTGAGGADTFWFLPANGRMGDNVITDYNAGEGDQIALFGAGFVREDTQVGEDVVITVDDSSGNLLGTITVLDTLLIDL